LTIAQETSPAIVGSGNTIDLENIGELFSLTAAANPDILDGVKLADSATPGFALETKAEPVSNVELRAANFERTGCPKPAACSLVPRQHRTSPLPNDL